MRRVRTRFRQFGILSVMLASMVVPVAVAQDSLSIAAQSTMPQFQLISNPTPTNNLILMSNWNLPSTLFAQLSVCVYMTSPMTGTGNNSDTIPASAVQVNGSSIVTGSTSCGIPSAFPVVTNALIWFLGGQPSNRTQNGYRQDTLAVRLSGYPNNLEPDTYTGAINVILSVQ